MLGHLVIANNQAGPNAEGVDCFSYWSGGTNTVFSADQYSQAAIPTIGYYASVIVRAGATSTPNRLYEAYVTATQYGIGLYLDGSWSTLIYGSTCNLAGW